MLFSYPRPDNTRTIRLSSPITIFIIITLYFQFLAPSSSTRQAIVIATVCYQNQLFGSFQLVWADWEAQKS